MGRVGRVRQADASERRRVDPSVVIMLVVAIAATALTLWRGGPSLAAAGGSQGLDLFLRVAPQLVIGFMLAGMVTVLLPAEFLGRYVGEESGMLGLAIATVAGAATPGGPFLQFPLVAALVGAGAGVGPMAAYLTAWSLMGWHRIVIYELPLLGASFTGARLLVSLVLPIVVGLCLPPVLRLLAK